MSIFKSFQSYWVGTQDTLTMQRRVYGLKCTLAVLILLGLLVLVTNIILPTAYTELGARLVLITNVFAIIANLTLLYFLTVERYNLFLALMSFILISYFLIVNYAAFLGADNILKEFSERLVTDIFSFPIALVVVSALLLRPEITVATAIFLTAFIALQQLPVLLNDSISVGFNWDKIYSETNIVNGAALVGGWLSFLVSSVSAVTLAWLVQKSSIDAAKTEKTNQVLGRYFSPDIREEIENSEFDLLQKVGREQQVAVLFTDIKGFTQLSEQMQPKDVVEFLSEYQKRMVGSIFTNSGTVDKYIGDAVMATFGTPESRGNDAQNALDCARSMQVSLRQWNKERLEQGLPTVEHRIGIHVGPSIVGNIGGEDRMEFTVVGDTVNVASRICDSCKTFERDVLISEDLLLRLDERLKTELFANVKIRGRQETMSLHGVTL